LGAVLSYENGASIDEHQMVLRFNDAPTKGFELYVGGTEPPTHHAPALTAPWRLIS
jgi:hypothetical protein